LVLIQFGKQGRLRGNQSFPGSLRDLQLRLEAAVRADMQQFVAALDQNAANQQAAMAVRRVFLAAHQGHSELRHTAFQPFNAALEERIARALTVEDATARVVVIVSAWASAEFFAEEEVFDAASREIPSQSSLIELRRKLRVRRRPRIDDDLNAVAGQQSGKRLEAMRGMADGVDGAHRRLLLRIRIPPNGCDRSEINAKIRQSLLQLMRN